MFNNLIESSSHKKELERKGTFFLGTLAAYAVLLACAGVASIYTYDAQLGEQNLDTAMLVLPFTAESIPQIAPAVAAPRRNDSPQSLAEKRVTSQMPVRQNFIEDIRNSSKPPDNVGTVGSKELPALPGAVIGATSSDPIGGSASAPSFIGDSEGSNANNRRAAIDVIAAEPPPAAPPKKAPPVVTLGVINGKALQKPVPPYPLIAKAAHITGTVTVQVLLSEIGKVISAQAVSGPPLLRDAAVRAAYQARFSPTLLSNQPVKVSGVITYNFKLE